MVIFALHKLIIYGAFTIVQAIQNILKSRFWIWHFYNIMIYYYRQFIKNWILSLCHDEKELHPYRHAVFIYCVQMCPSKWNRALINVINYTYVLPAKKCQNGCCEKGLSSRPNTEEVKTMSAEQVYQTLPSSFTTFYAKLCYFILTFLKNNIPCQEQK